MRGGPHGRFRQQGDPDRQRRQELRSAARRQPPIANLRIATSELARQDYGRAPREDRVALGRNLQRGVVPCGRAIPEEGRQGLPRGPATDAQVAGSGRAGPLQHGSGAAGLQQRAHDVGFAWRGRWRRCKRASRHARGRSGWLAAQHLRRGARKSASARRQNFRQASTKIRSRRIIAVARLPRTHCDDDGAPADPAACPTPMGAPGALGPCSWRV